MLNLKSSLDEGSSFKYQIAKYLIELRKINIKKYVSKERKYTKKEI